MVPHVKIQQIAEQETKPKLSTPTPYLSHCKNNSGAESPICAVFEIERQSPEGYLFVRKPSRNCVDADKIIIARSHKVPAAALFHGAHMSAYPLPVKYDTASVNGQPVVGETVGTVDGSWKLSSDYEGFRVVRVVPDKELIWVVPAHMWGMEEPPFQNILDAEWYLFDQPPPYKGVRFEIFVREIGSGGDGQWIPAHFDSFGHLLRLNDGAGTTEGTTPAETTDPFTTGVDTTEGVGTTANPPVTDCPSSITITVSGATGNLTGMAGTVTLPQASSTSDYCRYYLEISEGATHSWMVLVQKTASYTTCGTARIVGAILVRIVDIRSVDAEWQMLDNRKCGTTYIGRLGKTVECWSAGGAGTATVTITGWGA